MGLFDGKVGWDDAILFPSLVTDAAWSGGKKVAGWVGADGVMGGSGGAVKPDFSAGKYGDGAKKRYSGQMNAANATTNQGLGLISGASAQSQDVYDRGAKLQGVGMNTLNASQRDAQFARADQGDALGMMRGAAQGTQPSQAEILGRAQIDANARAMQAQAAAARGGNAAAAMRTAQATSSQNALQGAQQLSALRAEEMDRARASYFGAATGMRAQDAQNAQLGAGLVGTGLQAQTTGTGLQLQAGNSMADVGMGREQAYLGAYSQAKMGELQSRVELERARMAAEAAARSGNQAFLGGLFGTIGAVGGTYYGGPAGGAAGGAAGNAVGRKVGGG